MNGIVEFHTIKAISERANIERGIEWIHDGYVAPGVHTDLSALVKAGKTDLMLALIEASLAEHFFLGRETRRCPWIYLTEQSPASLWEAITRAGLTGADELYVVFHAGVMDLPFDALIDQVTVKAVSLGAAVVIDTIHPFVRLAAERENDAASVLEKMRPIQSAINCGVPVLTCRHERKSQGAVGEAARGSGAISGSADILMALRRLPHEDGGTRRELLALSRFSATPPRLLLDRTSDGYDVIEGGGGSDDTEELEHVAERIWTLLGDQVMTEAELRDKERSKLVPKALRLVLLARGLVNYQGKGVKGDPKRYRRNARASSFHAGASTRKNAGAENAGSSLSKEKNAGKHFSRGRAPENSGTRNGHVADDGVNLLDDLVFASVASVGAPEGDE